MKGSTVTEFFVRVMLTHIQYPITAHFNSYVPNECHYDVTGASISFNERCVKQGELSHFRFLALTDCSCVHC